MATSITCGACGKEYQIPNEVLGKKVKCSCGHKFIAIKPDPKPDPEETATKYEKLIKLSKAGASWLSKKAAYMNRKYLAFDIETAKIIEGKVYDLKSHRPLGITCIASQCSDEETPRIWMSKDASGDPASQMSRADIQKFVDYLMGRMGYGYVPLSWNGLSFDFDILAEESGLVKECQKLAKLHVDMMFHVMCVKGFPVALDKAAKAMGLDGKLSGVDGSKVPSMWAKGDHEKVIQYVTQDVATTLQLATITEKEREFKWITQRGRTADMPLPNGWLSVSKANKLPLPDVSWMDDPPERSRFMDWL